MNWHERIEAARERGGFTDDDIEAAEMWPDCACGEADPRIPRHPDTDAPLDGKLWALGIIFEKRVRCDRFDLAAATLARIEARASEILGSN